MAFLGVTALAPRLSTGTSGFCGLSQDSSIGHNCCSTLSMNDFLALSSATRMTPSLPLISFTMIPMFHLPLFRLSLRIKTTSPGLTDCSDFLWLRLCLSQTLHILPDHLDHNASLQRRRYLALFLKSTFPSESVSFSGNRLG